MHTNHHKPFIEWMEKQGWLYMQPPYANAPMHFTRLDESQYLNEHMMHAIYDERGGVDELAGNYWSKFVYETQQATAA